jgi:uncharacterized membrane protein YphA (DoxX/SURF4 family)
MFIATVIVSVVLAGLLVVSGIGKLRHDLSQMKTLQTVGLPEDRAWLLATAEIAGAAGLLAGLFWWPIGVAAAIGVVLYFAGAIASHLRVRDPGYTPAAVLLVVAAAAVVLRVVSA